MDKDKFSNLEQLLDRIEQAADEKNPVSLGAVLNKIGSRSFGPLLIVTGLATLAPIIGDIPGVPTIIGITVFLISVQLLFKRKHLWFPPWLLKRSVDQKKLCKAIGWLRRPARFFDGLSHQRFTIFTKGWTTYLIAFFCMIIAAVMPIMELVPFSANLAGITFSAFGLALITQDGLISLLAFCFTLATIGVITYNLL